MNQDIKKELLEYFTNIPESERTEQENRFALWLRNEIEFFSIARVAREDVDWVGYDGQNMTDAQMERLANKLGDAYIDNGFWIDLPIIVEYLDVPQLKDSDHE